MKVSAGKWYATQRGRIVGPLIQMGESYRHDNYFEPGVWDAQGRCGHPESMTGWSYGNIVAETEAPKEEELIE